MTGEHEVAGQRLALFIRADLALITGLSLLLWIAPPALAGTSTLLPLGNVLIAGGEDPSGEASAAAALYEPGTDRFNAQGPMGTARSGHTATLINGKVLIVGGRSVRGETSSAELYDFIGGTFTLTGSMGTPRRTHTATLFLDGTVLIAGGIAGTAALASTELYNPAIGAFAPTAAMGISRFGHTATLLPDGRVLMAGGDDANGPLAAAELYDPATRRFTPTGPLSTARFRHTATLLSNGQVLIAGGSTRTGAVASAELYDPGTGVFTPTGPLSTARFRHTATLLSNGQVLIAGGTGFPSSGALAAAELYDPATRTFTPTGAMGTARQDHTATLLSNGQVLIAGGAGLPSSGASRAGELYDPASGTFLPTGIVGAALYRYLVIFFAVGLVLLPTFPPVRVRLLRSRRQIFLIFICTVSVSGLISDSSADPDLQAPHTSHLAWATKTSVIPVNSAGVEGAAAGLIGGKIYVSHGFSGGDNAALRIYDIAGNTWSLGPSATVARSELVGAVVGGKLYAIGGRNNVTLFSVVNDVEIFDPAGVGGAGSWSTGTAMPTARAGLGAAVVNGKIHVLGGRTTTTPHSSTAPTTLGTHQVYDPVANTWDTSKAPLPTPMADIYATVAIGQKIYVFGGWDGTAVSSLVQIYDVATNTWSTGTAMPTARSNAIAGIINGHAIVIGGLPGSSTNVNTNVVEIYHPATNTWTIGPTKTTASSEMAAAAPTSSDTIFAIGSGAFGVANSVHEALTFTNNAPVITSDGGGDTASVNVAENTTAVTTVTATDADVPADTLTFSLSGGADQARFSITPAGNLSFINAPNFESPADADTNNVYEVEVQVSDGNGGTDTQMLNVTVTNANDAPTAANNTVVTNEDTAYTFAPTDFNFADEDAGDSLQAVTVVTVPASGSLKLSGVAVIPGQVIAVADLIAGNLKFLPVADANGAGYASFTFTVSDGTLSSSPPNTLTINVTPVNDAPSFTKGADQGVSPLVLEDAGPQTVAGWAMAISKGPANESSQTLNFLVTVNYSGPFPALFSAGPAVDPVTGNLTYTPAADANGTATIDVELMDSGGTDNGGVDKSGVQSFMITVTPVNDPPEFVAVADPQPAVLEDSNPHPVPFTDVRPGPLTAVDELATQTVHLTAAVVAPSALLVSPLGLSATSLPPPFNPAALPTVTVTYNTVLHQNNATEVIHTGAAPAGRQITFTATDDGPGLLATPQTFQTDVTPVNDPPELVSAIPLDVVAEDTNGSGHPVPFSYRPGPATATDEFSGPTAQTVTLSVVATDVAPLLFDTSAGKLTVTPSPFTFPDVDATPDTATGTVTYNTLPDQNELTEGGNGTLTLTLDDGQAQNNTLVVPISVQVTPVNDAPVNTVPGPQAVNEDTPLVFTAANGNLIMVADVDSEENLPGNTDLQVTLSVLHGTLTLATTAGLSFTFGDGTADAQMTFTGKVAAINTALATLTYLGNLNFNSLTPPAFLSLSTLDTLTLITNDLGHTGSGGALSDTDTVTITVNPVNDEPVFTVSNQVVDEDTPVQYAFLITGVAPASRVEPPFPGTVATDELTLQTVTVTEALSLNTGLIPQGSIVVEQVTVPFDPGLDGLEDTADDVLEETVPITVGALGTGTAIAGPFPVTLRVTYNTVEHENSVSQASGTNAIRITIQDDGGTTPVHGDDSRTQAPTITVNPVNDPPTVSASTLVFINPACGPGESTPTIPCELVPLTLQGVTVDDPDLSREDREVGTVSLTATGIPLTIGASFTCTPSNTSVACATIATGGTPPTIGSGTLTWTTNLAQAGSYNVTFTATDNAGATGSANKTLNIADETRCPDADRDTFPESCTLASPPAPPIDNCGGIVESPLGSGNFVSTALVPNDQVDSDGDGIGDSCDDTPAGEDLSNVSFALSVVIENLTIKVRVTFQPAAFPYTIVPPNPFNTHCDLFREVAPGVLVAVPLDRVVEGRPINFSETVLITSVQSFLTEFKLPLAFLHLTGNLIPQCTYRNLVPIAGRTFLGQEAAPELTLSTETFDAFRGFIGFPKKPIKRGSVLSIKFELFRDGVEIKTGKHFLFFRRTKDEKGETIISNCVSGLESDCIPATPKPTTGDPTDKPPENQAFFDPEKDFWILVAVTENLLLGTYDVMLRTDDGGLETASFTLKP